MYNEEDKKSLMKQAKASIQHGLRHKTLNSVEKNNLSNYLTEVRASFVTLHLNDNLRGCIGSLNAIQPLIDDVNSNAYAAAFNDPRFEQLTENEFQNITIEISVLSIPEKIIFSDENDLLSQLRKDIDGLIFECNQYRSTYLPSVWSSLPTPKLFLSSLKEKAGINSNFWSKDIRCYRYTTEIIK